MEGRLNYSAPFFIKRPHFSFEQEARILLSTYSAHAPTKDTPPGITVDLDLVEAIQKVLVHPDCHDWFAKVVKSISRKYGLKASVEKGVYGNKIEQGH